MERLAYKKLLEWKNSNKRKPLIVNGARQVGKTWLLKEFGLKEYDNVAYINCDEIEEINEIFKDYHIDRLIRTFSTLTGEVIKPQKTLIILDEIQVVPKGLTSLKYFCEDAPEYHIAVAGSLLGIGIHEGTGFPVGKVDEISLYPLSFKEFILALGNTMLVRHIEEHRWEELNSLSPMLIEFLRQYYYVGGMPAVVNNYCDNKDIFEVRNIQKQILSDYRRDFSKHIPSELLPKVNLIWDSIPAQLSRENKKFIYSAIKKGGRAKEFENAIQWLVDAGLVYKVLRVSKVDKPLKFYEDFDAFKLFVLDLGLLGALSDVDAKDVLVNSKAFTEYKGAFTEQYVLQELEVLCENVYYHSKERSTLEIDFVVQKYNVYPIEVKAEENLRAKSLKLLYDDNSSLKPVRFSMSNYREQDWMVNVPLALAGEWITAAE